MTREEAWDAYQQAEAEQEAARKGWQAATDRAQAAYQQWQAADRVEMERHGLNPGDEAVVNGADW